jgi:hypothetical protein
MAYKIKKATPSNIHGQPMSRATYSFNEARRELKDILSGYQRSYDAARRPGDTGYQEQEAYLHNKGRNLVSFDGGDRIEYTIYRTDEA